MRLNKMYQVSVNYNPLHYLSYPSVSHQFEPRIRQTERGIEINRLLLNGLNHFLITT